MNCVRFYEVQSSRERRFGKDRKLSHTLIFWPRHEERIGVKRAEKRGTATAATQEKPLGHLQKRGQQECGGLGSCQATAEGGWEGAGSAASGAKIPTAALGFLSSCGVSALRNMT